MSDSKFTDVSSESGLLRLVRKRFSGLLGALPVGVLIVSADGTIESVNQTLLSLFGYADTDLLGSNLSKLILDPPWSRKSALLEWYQEQGQSLIELRGLSKNDEVLPIDVSICVFDADRTDRLLVVIQDVTERFVANELKRGFFQMINHDLRSPLTNVVMFLKMMEKRDEFGTLTLIGRERLQSAVLNVERILHLADDLLQLESLESSVGKLKRESIDVAKLVKQAVDCVIETADAKNIRFNIEVDPSLDQITGDSFRLEQVLVNLLSNGIGYSKNGLPMKFSVQRADSMIQFAIHDNGPGVPESEKLMIFEKFKQGSRKGAGSYGLGLAICSEIVRQHGGTIGCKDNPTGGSIFWFALPLPE